MPWAFLNKERARFSNYLAPIGSVSMELRIIAHTDSQVPIRKYQELLGIRVCQERSTSNLTDLTKREMIRAYANGNSSIGDNKIDTIIIPKLDKESSLKGKLFEGENAHKMYLC